MGKFKNIFLSVLKYKNRIILIGVIVVFYFLMMSPIFFMYPKHRDAINITIEPGYFYDLSDSLSGDCFRKTRKFMQLCPFPTREIHLNSNHTILEILINGKWFAYDPSYDKFFDYKNAIQISFDIHRGYIPSCIKNYPYKDDFNNVKYYHNWYFVLLNYTHPYYDDLMRLYYTFVA